MNRRNSASLSKLRRWVWLSGEERRFVTRAWLAAPVVEASLATVGLSRTLRWIEAVPPRRRARSPSVEAGERLVGHAYAGHLLRGACLPRSLLQYLLHRRDGVEARFVVGVRRTESATALAAHAWVEEATRPRANDDYQPLARSEERARP